MIRIYSYGRTCCIRQATNLSNRYISAVALALGIAYATFEATTFDSSVLLSGGVK
ncbi:hypothetical protein [Paranoxybacillus vitaminiphilus]|uniref:hypothetical protein n=1 Tax=Paranoxybacillus vitaminiphilus TaxID=581036 RepID=UPI001FE84E97|nr:hypothetical protein [Anoxybacillus vitaminiphilus]